MLDWIHWNMEVVRTVRYEQAITYYSHFSTSEYFSFCVGSSSPPPPLAEGWGCADQTPFIIRDEKYLCIIHKFSLRTQPWILITGRHYSESGARLFFFPLLYLNYEMFQKCTYLNIENELMGLIIKSYSRIYYVISNCDTLILSEKREWGHFLILRIKKIFFWKLQK